MADDPKHRLERLLVERERLRLELSRVEAFIKELEGKICQQKNKGKRKRYMS